LNDVAHWHMASFRCGGANRSLGIKSTRPSTTLADFERHGIPKSVFL
jgi:hypothetical protein